MIFLTTSGISGKVRKSFLLKVNIAVRDNRISQTNCMMPIPVYPPTFLSIAIPTRTMVSAFFQRDENATPGFFPWVISQVRTKNAIL